MRLGGKVMLGGGMLMVPVSRLGGGMVMGACKRLVAAFCEVAVVVNEAVVVVDEEGWAADCFVKFCKFTLPLKCGLIKIFAFVAAALGFASSGGVRDLERRLEDEEYLARFLDEGDLDNRRELLITTRLDDDERFRWGEGDRDFLVTVTSISDSMTLFFWRVVAAAAAAISCAAVSLLTRCCWLVVAVTATDAGGAM